jgi:hypothetical protein
MKRVTEEPDATLGRAIRQEEYGARYNFLRSVQKPFFAIGWRIEQECARIEAKHELDKWNRTSK